MIGKNFHHKNPRGFTLIELMMSIAIMLLMTGVLLAKYPDSTTKITLANANSALSLLIHEAQLRGSSVDSVNSKIGGYGIFFNRATSTNVVLFADIVDDSIVQPQGLGVGNGLYDMSPKDERKSVTRLQEKYSYKKLCVGSSTAPAAIAPNGFICNENNFPEIDNLTISFSRPSQIAHIYINNDKTIDFGSACIQLYSPKSPEVGHVRSLKVYHSGMVTTGMFSCN